MTNVIIVGAGLAGLSAAVTLSEKNIPTTLISVQESQRAQSVLAEGGINAALNTMGEDDCPENHFEDTVRSACYIADEEAVKGLTDNAPKVVEKLISIGVPFNNQDGKLVLRNFGGQKKKRTAYSKSSTGKTIMNALIDEVRKYEARGLVNRFSHHEFRELILSDDKKECVGIRVRDNFNGEYSNHFGKVILAFGGMNGMFPEVTTGTYANTGDALAQVFSQGVELGNLEMIQYHPTTIGISGKRCLISEAARGEGGRLYIKRNGQKWYFMEDKYPEYGNLMPRDVVAREMYFVAHSDDCDDQVYLDMTELSKDIWKNRLPDLRKEIIHYKHKDPAKEPIEVEPGIHYFMGGIKVDAGHRTNMKNLYAAGECCCQYHGANRLGGNSMLGAVYGGMTAANTCASEQDLEGLEEIKILHNEELYIKPSSEFIYKLRDIMLKALGVVRSEKEIDAAIKSVDELIESDINEKELNRARLAKAILISAKIRKESRGAHYRSDYPDRIAEYKKETISVYKGEVFIGFEEKR